MLVVRSFILIATLSALAVCQTGTPAARRSARTVSPKSIKQKYVQVYVGELLRHPTEFQGRRVTLTAAVVSVNARQHSLEVYDQHSRAQIGVSLTDVSKTQRRRLVVDPVHQVAVFGRVEMQNGRPLLKAEQVKPVEQTLARR